MYYWQPIQMLFEFQCKIKQIHNQNEHIQPTHPTIQQFNVQIQKEHKKLVQKDYTLDIQCCLKQKKNIFFSHNVVFGYRKTAKKTTKIIVMWREEWSL